MEFEYNCNNDTCNCAINKKYHLSDVCLESNPCQHYITYLDYSKEKHRISSIEIVRLFQEDNLPIPSHYQGKIELVKKMYNSIFKTNINNIYNCNNNTCNCAINKKYHLSEICLQTYPCRHSITYINERKETNTISSANIVRLFQKENLPIPSHYEKLIEYVRKQDHPTPEEINEKYTNKEKELRERIRHLEIKKKEKDELDHIINTTKASSRIERLKNKHSISGAPIIEEPPKQRRDIYSYDFDNEIIILKKEYENLLKQMNKT